MKRTNELYRYSMQDRKWAFVDALNAGWSVRDTAHNPECIAWMVTRLAILTAAERNEKRPGAPSDGPAVQASPRISSDYEPTDGGFFHALADVGTLRGLHLVSDGGGGYTATIKVTLQDGRQVYRYGRLRDASGIEEMLYSTIRKDRWTPDKL